MSQKRRLIESMNTMASKQESENKIVKNENKLFGDEKIVTIELTLSELIYCQGMETELITLRAQNAQLLADNKQWAEYSAHIENESFTLKGQLETLLKSRFNLFGRFTKQTA